MRADDINLKPVKTTRLCVKRDGGREEVTASSLSSGCFCLLYQNQNKIKTTSHHTSCLPTMERKRTFETLQNHNQRSSIHLEILLHFYLRVSKFPR